MRIIIDMKASQIQDSSKLDLHITDMENMFDVFEDKKRQSYAFNLNATLVLQTGQMQTYKLSHDMFWTQLSFILYKTTRLWWLLMKLNNVRADEMFEIKRAGQEVKYISAEQMNGVLRSIQGMINE